MGTDDIASELLAALDANRTLDPISARDPDFDSGAAYSVSAEILRRRRARGETPVGRKIGFTNRGIWAEYGVSAPMWAHVYDTTVTFLDEASGRLAIGHLVQPRLEPEIVLHFADTPRPAADEEELLSTIDWMAHGFEIVQSHFPNWQFKLPDSIAAFGLHGALVVGPRRPVADLGDDLPARFRSFTISLADDRGVKARGAGKNVLGGPIAAAVYLLQVLKEQHRFEPVHAGEIVTTGTLLPPPPIHRGETWRTELSGIDLPGLCLHID
jgi:2-oxo-3-hexenedioate decarboxylase